MITFKNKLCWIVGASDGIGKAIAEKLLDEDASLIISSRNIEKLNTIKAAHPTKTIHIVPIDLENDASIKSAITAIENIAIPEHLFLVGGISQRSNFLDTDIETGERIIATNFWGHVKVSKGILGKMLEAHKHPGIIEISSIVGKFGYYRRSFYSASKHAVKGFFEALALEYHKQGLKICIAYPGKIHTDIALRSLKGNGEQWQTKEGSHEAGMSPEKCASIIIKDYRKGRRESFPGGREMLGLHINKFLPKVLFKILLKQNNL